MLLLQSYLALFGQTAVPQSLTGYDSLPEVERLRQYVFDLADDSMMGRMTGSQGYAIAARYVAGALLRLGVAPPFPTTASGALGYFHEFSFTFDRGDIGEINTFSVVGVVPGAAPDRRLELIVVSAHLDHIGTHEGTVYNGASDNASGVAVALEIARLVALRPLNRTVLFAFFGAEELGLKGSEAFVESMSNDGTRITANVNVDDIGHLLGFQDKPTIRVLSGPQICVDLIDIVSDFGDNTNLVVSTNDRRNVFERSDHYSFFSANIPVLFFTGGWEHRWLHSPEDDPEEMNYRHLLSAANLVYRTVQHMAADTTTCQFLRP